MPGYQHDPIAEHAAALELVDAVGRWQEAEQYAAHLAAWHLQNAGIRADVVAKSLGMSRATMYRWVAQNRPPITKPAKRGAVKGRRKPVTE